MKSTVQTKVRRKPSERFQEPIDQTALRSSKDEKIQSNLYVIKPWAVSLPKLKILSFKSSIGGTLWESEPPGKDILTV